MAKDYAIRGNSKMTQVDRDTITSDQLAQYLEAEILGCPIKTDFITTHGPGGGCYVVLDLTIHDQYLTQQAQTGNYVENFLAKHAAAASSTAASSMLSSLSCSQKTGQEYSLQRMQ